MRFALALATVAFAAAQALPDAQTILERAPAISKSFHTLQVDSEMTMETGLSAAPMTVTTETSSAYLNPGKSRMETQTAGIHILSVSDGENTWLYSSMGNQYTKIAAAQGPAAVMASLGIATPDPASIPTSSKTIREEAIEINGEKHDCWVIETRIGEITLPSKDKAPPRMTEGVVTAWLDKKLGISLQSTLAMTMEIGGKPMQMHQKTLVKSLKVDQPLDEALFTFTPPPDAKEVKEMKLFGASAAKPELAGKQAPAFEMKSIDGKIFSLAALKGKPVLLDFWATWCSPCRKSMPALEKIARENKKTDLVILGVNSGEERKAVEEFLKQNPLAYPAVLSGESRVLDSYQVTAYPTFILIGRDGKIVANEIGFSDEDQLRDLIAQAALTPK